MNGRRAWRRYLKRWRRNIRKDGRCPLLRLSGWMRRHAQKFPPVHRLMPRPWTARSLVGASMGARKRKAGGADRFHCVCGWVGVPYDLEEDDSDEGRLICPECSNPWADMQTERSRYRIGERLRPCRPCELARQGRGYDLCKNRIVKYCDGSGVLPAKSAGKAKR